MSVSRYVPVFAGGLALAAAIFASGAAQAQTPTDPRNQCGALSSGAATCSDRAYGIGIQYDAADGWGNGVAGDVALTVTGGSSTTITSPVTARGIWGSGIVVRTAEQTDGSTRTIALTVGSGSNAVAIRQSTNTLTGGLHNTGVVVHQRGGGADATTVTLGSGVTIGASGTPMKKYGVHVLVENSGNSATHTITSAAAIHSVGFGLLMDNRGSGDSAVTNTGSITTAATGGTTGQQSGIRVLDWTGTRGDDRTADTTTTVTNSGSVTARAANAHGIHVDADGLGLYGVAHSGTISVSGRDGHGIHVQASYHAGTAGSEAVEVESSGAITTTGAGGHGILVDSASNSGGEAGDGDIAVTTTGGAIATTGAGAHGIHVGSAGDGGVTVTNAAAIEAGASSSSGIHVGKNPANEGDIAIVNSGAIDAGQYGIVVWYGGESDVSIRNSGAISGATPAVVGIHVDQAGVGDVTIRNSADVTGSAQGIFARNTEGGTEGGGAVTVTHSAGEVAGGTGSGIDASIGRWRSEDDADSPAPNSEATVRVEVTGGTVKGSETRGRVAVAATNNEGGSIEVSVSKGAALEAQHNAGIFAYMSDRQNTGGRIDIDQGGAITAAKGVYASVPRASAAGETRAADDQPLIDVAWTGTFTEAGRAATVTLNNVAHAVESAQEAQAGAAGLRGAAYSAGIDAEVMSWRVLNRVATRGDDPGPFADAAAVTALFDDGADAATKARAAAIVARFRAVLEDGALGTIPGADDIDTDGTAGYSDAEIEAYLGEDDAARRTLLRDALARHLSEREAAVLRALAANDNAGLETALAAVTGATDAWKREVRLLAGRRNVGDVRVAMTAGSISSRGDGIRAWFASPHDDNGAISVTVAEGTTVTGGAAGIYVANAGTGLSIAKKYTPPEIHDAEANRDKGPDDLVALPTYRNQVVRVDGTVTGGTDAAVHLDGGGALIVGRTGKLIGGSSGQAILVNDPAPAVIYIDGEAAGGEGAADDAAVRLTGGGTVVVGLTGRVRANGADFAIRLDRPEGDATPTAVVVHAESGRAARFTQESVGAALMRIAGGVTVTGAGAGIVGDRAVVQVVETTTVNGREVTTGYVLDGGAPLDAQGNPTVPAELPPEAFRCDLAGDERCRLYEALPSALLAMNGLPDRAARMSAARDGAGAWALVEAGGGKWVAGRAASANLSYDLSRYGVRAGADMGAAGENTRFGVAAHGVRGSAKTPSSGKAKLSGVGFGVYAEAAFEDGVQLDVQAATSWYDVDVEAPLARKDDVRGRGHAVSLELGRRIAATDNMTLVPRAGLLWSDATLGGFDEVTTNNALAGAAVTVEDAESLTGSVGLGVESTAARGMRLFGALDVSHEFSGKAETSVSGTALKSSPKKTALRVGVGGVFDLGGGASLSGTANYATAGGGTREFGGGLSLDVRF